jgi:signal transduction histidine kinase
VRLATVRALLRVRHAEAELALALANEKSARAEAERANSMKDAFRAMVSHELRTPLNAVTGAIWLLRPWRAQPEQLRPAVDVLERNAQVQVQLIDDLLDISRIAAANSTSRCSPSIWSLWCATRLNGRLRPPAHQRKNIALSVQTAPAMVHGDAARLEQGRVERAQ